MLYRGYWIEFVSFSEEDGSALFLIRKRHEVEILAQAGSVSQALQLVSELEIAQERPSHLRVRRVSA